jgi:hypothetical protein
MDESSSLITVGSRTLGRTVNVAADIIIKGSSATISDTLDDICVSAEEAIAADFHLNGLAKSCILTDTNITINVEGERSVASARLVYTVDYVTSISDVETAR